MRTTSVSPPEPPKSVPIRLHDGEPQLFLHLATALKVLLTRTIDDPAIERGSSLLRDYLRRYREVCHFIQPLSITQ